MDEQAIEAKALTPLRDELKSIGAIGDRRALAAWIGGSLRADVDATRTESADMAKGNNPWTRADFNRRAPGMDWAALFHAARIDHVPTIIVWHPGATKGIAALVQGVSLATWRDYLAFHAIDRHAAVLPKAYVDERLAFYGKVLSGTPEQQERWKRAVDATDAALGEAVGKIYVQQFF